MSSHPSEAPLHGGSAVTDIEIIPADELSAEDQKAWVRWQQNGPFLDSPFLGPDFVQATAAHRPGVEIALLGKGSERLGFFPYHRDEKGYAAPVAHRLTAAQAPILAPACHFDLRTLLQPAGLRGVVLDYGIPGHASFTPHVQSSRTAHYIDLSQGFDAHQEALQASGSKVFKRIGRLARKLEREHGPAEFTLHDTEAGIFDALVRLKTERCEAHGQRHIFGDAWVVAFLEALWARKDRQGSYAQLSTLRVGGEAIAFSLAIRDGGVAHGCVLAHDARFDAYSPGNQLLQHKARALAEDGVHRYELGLGDDPFKSRIAPASVELTRGHIDRNPLVAGARALRRRAGDWARAHPELRSRINAARYRAWSDGRSKG